MVLQCLMWIPELWIQLINSITRKECTNRQFPDNVVFEILTRLPPESVMRCRKVCKQWLAITSSPYFADMHHQKTSSIVLVQMTFMEEGLRELILLAFYKDSQKFKRMHAGWLAMKDGTWAPRLLGCCHTKLVFVSWSQIGRYYLCSLLTREIVVVEPPQPSVYFGIFFHPIAREYKLLFYRELRTNLEFEIFIYCCGSKTWRELTVISYRPCIATNQVELNGNLHWVVKSSLENVNTIHSCRNSIIKFDMNSEKFSYMPHPGRACQMPFEQENMYLLEMEGILCFGRVWGRSIWIWVLEDYENWTWNLQYNVDLNWDRQLFPFKAMSEHLAFRSKFIRLWNIRNGKLMISWFFRGLFRYHLEHNIIEQLDYPQNEPGYGFLVTLELSH